MTTYSVNDVITFRLTTQGRKVLENFKVAFVARWPHINPSDIGPREDADNTCRWPLWCVMELFGPHISAWNDCMIEQIRFEPKEARE